MPYLTPLLDQRQKQLKEKQEQERLAILAKVLEWLTAYGQGYGIYRAYVVGSLTRAYQFTSRSDIDVAVEQIDPRCFFWVMAQLSEHLERDVDIIELAKCYFGARLRQQGILWTAIN
ncbi:MAG: nucleotidyltransferase domain-containing protein [Cyanobacteria bacterium RI_101]|nr:nucleotidyltransferase domain-containing protein [Cyanobacteria bacterium RI_101]